MEHFCSPNGLLFNYPAIRIDEQYGSPGGESYTLYEQKNPIKMGFFSPPLSRVM